ncbi:helicase-like transcription factor isoform X2 [Oncorhynchus mykiss]|uniref:Helicase-like transcription factor n=1 Tax=Oncorhynchus mykiss TaxID=8022 RepID=A0A8C7TSA2_ONCMY|nr:helicase-like transcription factor isoform X2 [Oncorhynchus mykiss]
MQSRRWFGGAGFSFADDQVTETLSQAIRGTGEELDREPDTGVLFGSLRGSVVGLRYYTGVVNKGEMVSLVRQPQNPYDCNAVMVANVYGSQVGHIKRELAVLLANIMDNNLARVEGVVPFGVTNQFTMSVVLSFWGREENRDAVLRQITSRSFKLQSGPTDGSRGLPRKSVLLTAEELKNAFDNLFENLMEDKIGEREAVEAVCTPLLPHQKQALSWMCVCENNAALPHFWEVKGELFYNTLTHSSVRERPQRVRGGILADDMGLGKTLTTIALILSNFHHGKPLCEPEKSSPEPKASTTARKNPEGKSGDGDQAEVSVGPAGHSPCMSANQAETQVESVDVVQEDVVEDGDEDWVSEKKAKGRPQGGKATTTKKAAKTKGKAVSTSRKGGAVLEDLDFAAALSGLTQGAPQKKSVGKSVVSPVEAASSQSTDDPAARATLIICPLSVLSNWLDQLDQHVRADVKLNVYLYYGSERNRDTHFLSSQHMVLTTYNVLSADYSGSASPLHTVSWLRVVLDEGHIIRNPNTQQSKAVLKLNTQRRWILTGTPIQNNLRDLWMLVAFLRLKPFDVREWWNRVIQRPVTQGDKTGLQNLQALVKCVTLRRTKASRVCGRPLVSLPERSVRIEEVELTQKEREEYELARTEGRTTISRYVAEGTVLRNYADVLAILVRLRQFCCHPGLLGKTTTHTGVVAVTPAELRERLIMKLRLVLGTGSDEECAVCLDSVRLPVITHCAHVYCRPCIAEVIRSEQEQARCPLCRGQIKASELVEFPLEEEEEESNLLENWRSSSKVEALMSSLLRLRSEDDSIRSLVVSQFTRFLTILEIPLREEGFKFVRLDGTMNQKRRAQVIQEFQSDAPGSPLIMLLSLKAGGVGINLSAASRVFLMDPAWNPAAEDQCVDRCHRLGQKRDVVITKFIVKGSVEENMVKIQRQKQDLVEKAFGTKNPSERKTSRVDEIRALMEL